MIRQSDIDGLPVYDGDLPSGTTFRHQTPFVIRPKDYFVADGDTLYLKAEKGPVQDGGMAYGLRLRSVMAPEKSKMGLADEVLKRHGMPYSPGNPGLEAKAHATEICRNRAVLVVPRGQDRFGRTLSDIYVSGAPGQRFSLDGSFSLEHKLTSPRSFLENSVMRWAQGERRPDERVTDEIFGARLGEDPGDRFWRNDQGSEI